MLRRESTGDVEAGSALNGSGIEGILNGRGALARPLVGHLGDGGKASRDDGSGDGLARIISAVCVCSHLFRLNSILALARPLAGHRGDGSGDVLARVICAVCVCSYLFRPQS
jgi:hypothetical protein